jgi:hypothetical protein
MPEPTRIPIEQTPSWAAYQTKLNECAAARNGSADWGDKHREADALYKQCEFEASGTTDPLA